RSIEQIRHNFSDVLVRNDLCYATTNRQAAVKELTKLVELILVIGAPNSSNCNRLREVAEANGVPAYLLNGREEMDPRWFAVVERHRPDDTFGFGVVFSDAALERFAQADPDTHDAIVGSFAHWDDVDVHYQGQVLTSRGHGFAGMARQRLLDILQRRGAELGVRLCFET